MKKNVGTVDRAVRVVVGVALIAWALLGTSEYAWAGWIGVAPPVDRSDGLVPAIQPAGHQHLRHEEHVKSTRLSAAGRLKPCRLL